MWECLRLNIFCFQNCFGFYCLDLVVLWENRKIGKNNVSSKLCEFEKLKLSSVSLVSLLSRLIRESSSKLLHVDLPK